VALTTAETVVVPRGADAGVWAAAIDVIREPAPPSRGRFLHRDFQPGNVLFDVPPSGSKEARIVGVVDWAAASWGPADLDVAHCATNLALLHGPAWGLRIAVGHRLGRAQRVLGRRGVRGGRRGAGGGRERAAVLAGRDALACSEEVRSVAQRGGRQEGWN
jgi:aminoglycoside phosphotransferase (APT) family kinase protein